MKTLLMISACLGFTAAIAGCSDEAQLDRAESELREEHLETHEEASEAKADGVVTEDEREEVAEEVRETEAAAGEVAEQAGDLIESKTD